MSNEELAKEVVSKIAIKALGEPTPREWRLLQNDVKHLAWLYDQRDKLKTFKSNPELNVEHQARMMDLIEETKRKIRDDADRLWQWRFMRRR